MAKFCSGCGEQIIDLNLQFCPKCGTSLPGDRASTPPLAPASLKKKWIILGVIVILIAISLGVLLAISLTSSSPDPIVGNWTVDSTGWKMKFDPSGTATLYDSTTGDYSIGRWEKIAEYQYQLYSKNGTPSSLLYYDPIAGAMHTDDFSTIFIKEVS
jgi:hypothetical protein